MTTLAGQLLVAMPQMLDPRFARSVVYVCAHSEEGATSEAKRPLDRRVCPVGDVGRLSEHAASSSGTTATIDLETE